VRVAPLSAHREKSLRADVAFGEARLFMPSGVAMQACFSVDVEKADGHALVNRGEGDESIRLYRMWLYS